MERPSWAPEDTDIDQPSPARVYDYFLGGSHNFAADRALAERFIAVAPNTIEMARHNRSFLTRAVRFLAEAGVRQFLDLGSGMPTVGNVHEIAQAVASSARVLYVDVDPVAVRHGQLLLSGNDRAAIIEADLRQPEAVLHHPDLVGFLDLNQPVAVLLLSVLHFISDADDPVAILAGYRRALATGSYLVISHLTSDAAPEAMAQGLQLSRSAAIPTTTRTRGQLEQLFAGFTLVEPGLVWAPQWRPGAAEDVGEHPERSSFYVGVGRTGQQG